ncbi:MAG: 2-oxo acid dehydrogenase subunit E2 [Deltaproteobacteria bacterium]|nr:2-oxo acid dehydrogenase subunit E2 [Deltaproteobacteria bacterium]
MFQKNIESYPVKKMPTWRKLTMAMWRPPVDPSAYGTLDIDMTKANTLLEHLRGKMAQKLTPTHLVLKAVALTMKKYPEINVVLCRNRLYQREHIDIFIQVFFKDAGHADLSGAKVRDADQKTLEQIAEELGGQASQIKKGNDPNLKKTKNLLQILTPCLLKWFLKFLEFLTFDLNWRPKFLKLPPDPFGAVMISNVGMFGLKFGFAPLTPLARAPVVIVVGEITDQAVVQNGEIVARPIMTLGITVDHRVMDGYLAGLTGGYLKELLENPEKLLS